jgi:plastocyanin
VTGRRLASALLLLACSLSAGAAQPATKPKIHTVKIEGMLFVPAALTIKPGDTVVWVNTDIVEHTATATAFDSKMIAAGKQWKHTFKSKGSFDYACKYHPPMKGTLTVR